MKFTIGNALAFAGAFILSFIFAYALISASVSEGMDATATEYAATISKPVPKESFSEKREHVLGELQLAIDDAVEEGKYHCCIEPACTMCYMGSWIWDDGTCDCDGMIAKGDFDKVCPQCKRGIEEGLCKSSNKASCETEA